VTITAHKSGLGWLLILAIALFVVLAGAAVVIRRRSRELSPVNYRAV
jgi:uncharacterized membrane protein YoaK (UPF0700 family)